MQTHLPIPMGRGFLHLAAVMDWASQAVLSWRLSNTIDASFSVGALEGALARFGKPEIFNPDPGGQFTSAAFTDVLKRLTSKSLWMAAAAGWIMSSSSVCGAR